MIQIIKSGFEKLDHLVTPTILVAAILKTMNVVNNIHIAGKIAIYLQNQLSARLCNKANMFIQVFFANLTLSYGHGFLRTILIAILIYNFVLYALV